MIPRSAFANSLRATGTTPGPNTKSPSLSNAGQIGTRERLAFGLLIYTGQRRSDVVRMRRDDLVASKHALCITQRKTGAKLVIPVHGQLAIILAAAERSGGAILQTPFGKPFTAAGFGNWMAERINGAGLPDRCVAHG